MRTDEDEVSWRLQRSYSSKRVCEKGVFGRYMLKTAKEGPNNGKDCLSE
jgi:hypothetical protein